MSSSPVKNYDFKNLMKLNMPNLQYFQISNIDITNDFTKILNKKLLNYIEIHISVQLNFDSLIFFKNVSRMVMKKKNFRTSIAVPESIFYLPQLSKQKYIMR